MFGSIGMPELVLIFVVALLVFGPRKLPDIGKSLGKGLAEFKRASDELKRTIENEIEEGKKEVASVREHIGTVASTVASGFGPAAVEPRPAGEPPSPAPPADSLSEPNSRPIHPS